MLKGGNKDKLIERLIRNDNNSKNPNTFKLKLSNFLEPTGVVLEGSKPTITLQYADTYKLVDKFNALLGMIDWPFRIKEKTTVWWIHTLKLLVVNAWVMWNDIKAMDTINNEEENLKNFIITLCNSLTE
jgi:hypothetical protein